MPPETDTPDNTPPAENYTAEERIAAQAAARVAAQADGNQPHPSYSFDEEKEEKEQEPGEEQVLEGHEEEEEEEQPTEEEEVSKLARELEEAMEEAGLENGAKKLIRRIHKLTDRRDMERTGRLAAEQRAEELEAQLQEVQAGGQKRPTASSSGRPLAWHSDLVELDQQLDAAEAAIAWARKNPDGGTVSIRGRKEPVEIGPEEVEDILDRQGALRTELLAKRTMKLERIQAGYEEEAKAASSVMAEAYPWTADKNSSEYRRAVELFEKIQNPAGLQSMPDWELWIADAIAGRAMREGQKASGKKPGLGLRLGRESAATEPTRQPSQGTRKPRASAQLATDLEQAEAQYRKTGSMEDRLQVQQLRRKARAAA